MRRRNGETETQSQSQPQEQSQTSPNRQGDAARQAQEQRQQDEPAEKQQLSSVRDRAADEAGEQSQKQNGSSAHSRSPLHWLKQIDIRLALYSILPDKYTDFLETQARYARITGYRRVTSTLLIAYMIVVVGVLAFLQLPLWQSAVVFAAALPTSFVLPYSVFVILAERRKQEIEQVLPDALLLMSANIESGLTVEKAFLLSARDEFGPLADDIRRTAMKMFGGTPVEEALLELAESTNSGLFEETLKLLNDGINAGGEASSLLESSAEDIRNSLHLREEIEANVKMYSIFILFASLLGAPLLFAVSTFLTETTAELWGGKASSLSDLPDTGVLEFHAPDFNVEFFRLFAVASLLISNTFASLIISMIKNGNVKNGIKFVPVFTVISVIVYFVVEIVVKNTIGSGL